MIEPSGANIAVLGGLVRGIILGADGTRLRMWGLAIAISIAGVFAMGSLGDTILFFMASTGVKLDFGIGAVVGVITGAYIATISLRDFRWDACEGVIELKRQMLGAC